MELSQLVLTRIKDPRLGFVTITHVDVTPDLRSACVYYSAMGDETHRKNSQTALENAAGFLQREISVTLKLRYTPRLLFKRDATIERSLEIDSVIRKIHQEDPGVGQGESG